MANESPQNNFVLPETNVVPTRRCDSYDPVPMMKVFQYEGGNYELYLEVKYRVDWFLHWCKENGVVGKIIESKVDFLPEVKMLLTTCSIYIDDKLAAESTAGFQISDKPEETNIAVQTAFTRAKGRALADLGFGTVNGNSGENGDNLPPDSGIPIPLVSPTNNPLMLMSNPFTSAPSTAEGNQPEAGTTAGPSPSSEKAAAIENGAKKGNPPTMPSANQKGANPPPDSPVSPSGIPKTVEEAKAFICPIGKENTRGKTLGHIYVTEPDMVKFYASEKFASGTNGARHPGLVAAAKLIVANE